jgi:hypothetical protein
MNMAKRIGVLLIFSIGGAFIMYLYGWASLQRSFVKWESLGKPPGIAIKVVALDYVQTISGDIYHYVYKQDCNDNCWVKSGSPSNDSGSVLPLDGCGELPPLNNFVDSKAVCRYYGTGRSLTIEAIDSKGYVYSWDYTFGGEWNGAIPWLSAFIGTAAGLFIGLIVLLVNMYLDLLKGMHKRAQQKSISENKS